VSMGPRLDFLGAPAGLLAAKGGDAGSARYTPAHAGELEPPGDHSLASRFGRAGSDEVTCSPKRLVSHSGRVLLEVAECGVEVFDLVGAEMEWPPCGEDRGRSPSSSSSSRSVSQLVRSSLGSGASSLARSERCPLAW